MTDAHARYGGLAPSWRLPARDTSRRCHYCNGCGNPLLVAFHEMEVHGRKFPRFLGTWWYAWYLDLIYDPIDMRIWGPKRSQRRRRGERILSR